MIAVRVVVEPKAAINQTHFNRELTMKKFGILTASLAMFAVTAGTLLAQPAPGGGGGFGGLGGGRAARNEEPTLRTALFDVVSRIGGPNAEKILVGQLQVTASAAEIVELDRLLEKMGGDRFKAAVLSAAHEVLKTPPDAAADAGEARNAEAQLYGLLVKYQDKTFLEAAQVGLVDKEGRIQRGPMDYLTRVLGKEALPAMQQLLATGNLSDNSKSEVRRFAQNFLGEHPVADAIAVDRFREISQQLANPPAAEPNGAGGGGRGRREDPRGSAADLLQRIGTGRDLTAESIRGRKQLVATLKSQVADTEVGAMMDKVTERLDAMADPVKAKTLSPWFTLRERQGGGGFGGFGGGGQRPPGGGGATQPPNTKGGN